MPTQPLEAFKARLARALWAVFGCSSEKTRGRVERLELALADIDELLDESSLTDNTVGTAAKACSCVNSPSRVKTVGTIRLHCRRAWRSKADPPRA
jgi:hypothetical protein